MAKTKIQSKKLVIENAEQNIKEVSKKSIDESIVRTKIKVTYIGKYGNFIKGQVVDVPRWLADEIGEK